ncbi:sugar O-acetyltransferase [Vagococcus sp. BWB3-3]|uniref:Sugar O-acetyltransferase n=1 Tax=Vagococcus allomyrinae TaxID=2794353 RepID=A0A940SYP0_9ENTE|nr:sugar O-acetyltransferase [Vagococcus allomyrinae]MBP1043588.1 sugar O-acetyltransferase [Vagococcus allomyrinae]
MTSEKEKSFAGEWYDPNGDSDLIAEREKAMELCQDINLLHIKNPKRDKFLTELFPRKGDNVVILNPIWADYGLYSTIGDGTFINHNAFLMDGGTITIGKNCLIGPNCGMYTATHALDPIERRTGIETALPIVIEDDVWLGGDVTILPGVTIGKGSIIGAKSLVNKDIPANVIAVGNPCKVLREITDSDKILTT